MASIPQRIRQPMTDTASEISEHNNKPNRAGAEQHKHASRVKHRKPESAQEKAMIQFSPELRADFEELARALAMGFGWKPGYSQMRLKTLAQDLASERP